MSGVDLQLGQKRVAPLSCMLGMDLQLEEKMGQAQLRIKDGLATGKKIGSDPVAYHG